MINIDTASYLIPDWQAPEQVKALVTTRVGGVSKPPYESFNLALHVGDSSRAVADNRDLLQRHLSGLEPPQWLQQVHGVEVVTAQPDGKTRIGDAVITDQLSLPCAVLTADCLPVFLCDREGTQVAVAHAGWRGLAAGVLETTLAKFNGPKSGVIAWLGPAIGPEHFEVGALVRERFLASSRQMAAAFTPNPENPGHWFADLYLLARLTLERQGVTEISGGGFCTFADQMRFYSYRRDGVTGRMASLIWLAGP